MKNLLSVILFLAFPFYSLSQNSAKPIQISPYTYIFKISEKEASRYWKHKNTEYINFAETDFHTLIDSFPTYGNYTNSLEAGHYLKVYLKETDLVIEPYTVNNCIVNIKNNSADLCIEVVDLCGNTVSDASVRINNRIIGFDTKARLYRIPKANKKGMLTVSWLGHTQYVELTRGRDNSTFKRGRRTLVYGTPLRYVILPLYNVIRLPFDGVKQLIVPYSYNKSYNYFRYCFSRIFNSINRNRYEEDGLMVFNKPVYRPGDTVRCKAFITGEDTKLIDKPLIVRIGNWHDNEEKLLGTVSPYRPGGYSYELILNKSLNLKIDKEYRLSFAENRYPIISGSFKLEDYELRKSNLEVRQPSANHIAGVPFRLFVKGTDENGLNLPDASLRLIITPKSFNEIRGDWVFIPDTLLNKKIPLLASGETEIEIPDSIFSAESMSYSVKMIMQTADFDTKEKVILVPFKHRVTEITSTTQDDSITLAYMIDGRLEWASGVIKGIDGFGNLVYNRRVVLPVTMHIDPLINSIAVEVGQIEKVIDMEDEDAEIFCSSSREKGKISLRVFNPQYLPFTYYLYRNNKQIQRGYDREFDYKQRYKDKKNYYLSLQYIWAGKVQNAEYSIPYRKNHLLVKVEQPGIVIPGQETQIQISVEDARGKPVPDADVTALAYTAKFNKPLPDIGDFIREKKHARRLINTFTLNNVEFKGIYSNHPELFNNWIKPLKLDTTRFYRLAYPPDSIFSYTIPTVEGITQFSPFITHDGYFEPIQAVYVDQRPVYIANSKPGFSPYSFAVSPGLHTIMIRTSTKKIMIRNVTFKSGYKTVFSVSDDAQLSNVYIKGAEKGKYSEDEEKYLMSYIMPVRNNFSDGFAYIKQHDNVFLQNNFIQGRFVKSDFAGPLRAEEFEFKQTGSWGTKTVFEPGFEYDFAPGLIKMRTQEKKAQPHLDFSTTRDITLADSVLTEKVIFDIWETLKLKKIADNSPGLAEPYASWGSTGKVILLKSPIGSGSNLTPLFHIVFRRGEPRFSIICRASTYINLEKGYYDIITIFPGCQYIKSDSVEVREGQTKVLNSIQTAQIHPRDSLSQKLCEIIYRDKFVNVFFNSVTQKDYVALQRSYSAFMEFEGDGRYITGIVRDSEDKGPIPGATVLLKGTSNGTLTDIDGKFRLKISLIKPVLQVSFVGMKMQEVEVGEYDNIDFYLSPSAVSIEGVVVTAYGITRQAREHGVSSATVSSQEMEYAQDNMMSGMTARVAGIQVTTNEPGATVKANQKLIIVDGIVFYGNWSDFDKSSIHHTEEISGEMAVARFGEKASNGAILVTTNTGFAKSSKGIEITDEFMEAAKNATSLRSNFSDYAFWQPQLRTDKLGKVSFKVRFPDDITNWQTSVIAITDKRKTGQTNGSVKAFKPLSAQIAMPRFLVAGDSVKALGKVINYNTGTVKGRSQLKVNSDTLFTHTQSFTDVVIDTLPFVAQDHDSVNITYSFLSDDGYFDGESRNLEIIPKGSEVNKGQFFYLQSDTMVAAPVFESGTDSVTISFDISELDVLLDETEKVVTYIYNCNEQMASKLKALLFRKYLLEYKGEIFDNDKEINKLIYLLRQNQNEDGMWGWWGKGPTSLWMSKHVIEAFSSAEKAGYKVEFDKLKFSQYLVYNSTDTLHYDSFIIAQLLSAIPDYVGLAEVIQNLERKKSHTITEKMMILELRQKMGIPVNIDSLVRSFDTTLYGNTFIPVRDSYYHICSNSTAATLSAYRIIRSSGLYKDMLWRIRNYFFEIRHTGSWRNTYESTNTIETLLPDITMNEYNKPKIQLAGDINQTISTFPTKLKISPSARFTIRKTGTGPVYISTYQTLRDENPKAKTDFFEISTSFTTDQKPGILVAGKKVTCSITVHVKKDADYIMLQVPIPAGCSYNEKTKASYSEAHREYYKNQVNIYLDHLFIGKYTFKFDLLPRYVGIFHLNPAKAEPMYLPLMYGNNEMKQVKIIYSLD